MKKTPPKILFHDLPPNQKRKIETLKMKIAAGEYSINPHNIAEKLMASGGFFMYAPNPTAHPWLFRSRSF